MQSGASRQLRKLPADSVCRPKRSARHLGRHAHSPLTERAPCLPGYALGGAIMIDPSSRLDRELKAAECFALSRTATSPFMRAYYQRIGERYLSSQGELRVPSETTRARGMSPQIDRSVILGGAHAPAVGLASACKPRRRLPLKLQLFTEHQLVEKPSQRFSWSATTRQSEALTSGMATPAVRSRAAKNRTELR
jgi:hypothetical protein